MYVHVHTIISYLPALINIKSLPKIELCYNDLIGYAYFYYHHETVLVGGQDDDICKNVNKLKPKRVAWSMRIRERGAASVYGNRCSPWRKALLYA